jgi:hypothetical protein
VKNQLNHLTFLSIDLGAEIRRKSIPVATYVSEHQKHWAFCKISLFLRVYAVLNRLNHLNHRIARLRAVSVYQLNQHILQCYQAIHSLSALWFNTGSILVLLVQLNWFNTLVQYHTPYSGMGIVLNQWESIEPWRGSIEPLNTNTLQEAYQYGDMEDIPPARNLLPS